MRSRLDLNAADLAGHTTLGSSTVKKFVADEQLQPLTPRIERELRPVIERAERGEILRPGGEAVITITEEHKTRVRMVADKHGHYKTQTMERIGQVLDYCAERAAIGLVTADYGVGKTFAVNHWRRNGGRKVDSTVYEFNTFTAGNKLSLIEALADALGVSIRGGLFNGARSFQAVVDHLSDNPCLLIFDQCEAARPQVLQVIRQIWDRTREAGVGIVLLAAPILLLRLKASQMRDLGALESRIGICAPLAGVSVEEMKAIVRQEGIADVEDEALSTWWRATGGSMRRLMASIELIQARHAGKRITAKTVTGVAGYLWGMQTRGEAA